MKFHPLVFACTCGHAAEHIQSVGLTSEYELVIHWTCGNCGTTVYATKSLVDCCREVPETEDFAEMAVINGLRASAAEDDRFLRSMGISMPKE
jgi:hypothetical protein